MTPRDWFRRRKEELVAYKGGKCFDCGGVFPACCYDFDHRVPSEKSFTISEMFRRGKAVEESLKLEADKCDLVCANCHRIRTQGNPQISEKISRTTRGREPWNKGAESPYSEETLALMSVGQRARFSKTPGTTKGRTMPPEQRKKISETMKSLGIAPSIEARKAGGASHRMVA